MLSHVLRDGRIRRIVECEMGEEQQGFRRGKSMPDGMFTLEQLMERDWRDKIIYSSGIYRPGEGMTCSSEADGHCHVEADGCPRGGDENGQRHI